MKVKATLADGSIRYLSFEEFLREMELGEADIKDEVEALGDSYVGPKEK